MSRAFSFIGLLIVLAFGLWYYATQIRTVTHDQPQNIRTSANMTGVRMDLLTISKAEQQHFAAQGRYMTLDEMRQAGDTGLPADERAGYQYRVEVTGGSFEATATYAGAPPAGMPRVLSVGPDGEVHQGD